MLNGDHDGQQVFPGERWALNADVYDASGALLDGRVLVTWSSSDTTAATVDSSGHMTVDSILGPGRHSDTFIRASVDGAHGVLTDSVEFLIFLIECEQSVNQPVLTGVVVRAHDARTGAPIAGGITVVAPTRSRPDTVVRPSASRSDTAAVGGLLGAGTWTLLVSHPGYVTSTYTGVVVPNICPYVVELDARLQPDSLGTPP